MNKLRDQAYERILRGAQSSVAGAMWDLIECAIGDTEIEKLFSTALVAQVWFRPETPFETVLPAFTKEALEALRENSRRCILLEPQVQFPWARVDFVIHAYCHYERFAPLGWRQLIVECDGHDFHERTKEQAARDRSRDRDAQLAGIEIFRFTGSELWRDAWGCAAQVIEWAEKGV